MKKQLLLIGKKLNLELDIRYIRINIHEMGYYITHKDNYVWSDNYYITKDDVNKKRFARKAKRMIQLYAEKYFSVQKRRDTKLRGILKTT